MRHSIASLFVVVPAAFVCVALAPTPAVPQCENVWPHEPVLLYEVAGHTLCCPIDLQLTVYGDGFARIAGSDAGEGRARTSFVGAASVQSLIADLGALGAGTACDRPDLITDVPLSTLTLMRGTTEGRARTYSWLGDDGSGGAITTRIDQFVASAFPTF